MKTTNIEMGKKYRTRDGWPARVLCVDARGTQRQVVAILENPHDPGDDFVIRTTMEGRFSGSSESGHDLIEVGHYDDFEIDEPVMVRCHEDAANLWSKRYFAGVMSGHPSTWDFGATSWSADNGYRSRWDECRRPTPEEMK